MNGAAANAREGGGALRFGLPEGPAWIWLLFVAPAIQVVSHADKVLQLTDWVHRALVQWRAVTHALWRDLFGWLHITLPFDEYELDGLTLGILCGTAAVAALLRGTRASLQADVMQAYELDASSRLILFTVISGVALAYFMVFVGFNALYLHGGLELGGVDAGVLLLAFCALGAAVFMLLLQLGAPLFRRVRIELVLGALMFAVGVVLLTGAAAAIGFDLTTEYLDARGLGWGTYILIVAGISVAAGGVLFVNWRVLPAIMVVAVTAIVADRVVQFLAPVTDYLNGLLS